MSSTVSTEEAQQIFIGICCRVSIATLLVYELLVTFEREYQLVWKRPFSAATLVFLFARYSTLLENILPLPTIHPLSTRSCSALIWLGTALSLLSDLFVAIFSSLRVYALSGRRWQIASLVLILSLVSFGVSLFQYVRQVVVVAPSPINCTAIYLVSPELTKKLTYVARGTTIAADALVLAVTIHQTYWRTRSAAEANIRTPLHTLVLRDGTIYFLVLFILNIADVILLYLGEIFVGKYVLRPCLYSSYMSQFIEPITTIIISRFMLNLRGVDVSQRGTKDSTLPSFIGSIQFAAFVEPLGAPLEHEFSFSSTDPGSLDEGGIDGESEHEDVPDRDEQMASDHASVLAPSEADPGPSGQRVS